MKHVLIGAAVAASLVAPAWAETEVTLARFFVACEDAGNDPAAAVGEACIVQAIINGADAAIEGVSVTTLPTDWGNDYDQLKAAYAAGNPPTIHVMHRHRVPEIAGFGALAAIGDDLAEAGIDPDDWAPNAIDAVTWNGQIHGVPMDFHANLWHLNLDILAESGLALKGHPVLPSSSRRAPRARPAGQ